jgi:hypothetical protein
METTTVDPMRAVTPEAVARPAREAAAAAEEPA